MEPPSNGGLSGTNVSAVSWRCIKLHARCSQEDTESIEKSHLPIRSIKERASPRIAETRLAEVRRAVLETKNSITRVHRSKRQHPRKSALQRLRPFQKAASQPFAADRFKGSGGQGST